MSWFTWLTIFASLLCISGSSSFSSLMRRSTLFTKSTGFTLSARACLRTVSVWGMTPSTAQTTRITPSTALIALVTSPPKSTCPGVSRRLIRYSSPS